MRTRLTRRFINREDNLMSTDTSHVDSLQRSGPSPAAIVLGEQGRMRLAIFGATGRTGRQLLEQALQGGHEVTAIVRNPDRLTGPPRAAVRVLAADVMDPAAIAPGISGSDAVISALSAPGRAPSTVMSDSARSIIQAMRDVGPRRLVAISGSMVDDTGDGPLLRYIGKPLARRILRGAYADMRRAEDEIHKSGLPWTILRPPRLTDRPASGHYRTAIDRNLPRAFTISRVDLAACALAVVNDATTLHRHVFVAQ
jgi:putative NADH-flavin reductase